MFFFPLFKEKSSAFTLLQVNFWFYSDSAALMLRLSSGTKKNFKIIFFVATNMSGNCPEVSVKTPSFSVTSTAGDVLTSHQKHLCFVDTNTAGNRPELSIKTPSFVETDTTGDVLTSCQKPVIVPKNMAGNWRSQHMINQKHLHFVNTNRDGDALTFHQR